MPTVHNVLPHQMWNSSFASAKNSLYCLSFMWPANKMFSGNEQLVFGNWKYLLVVYDIKQMYTNWRCLQTRCAVHHIIAAAQSTPRSKFVRVPYERYIAPLLLKQPTVTRFLIFVFSIFLTLWFWPEKCYPHHWSASKTGNRWCAN